MIPESANSHSHRKDFVMTYDVIPCWMNSTEAPPPRNRNWNRDDFNSNRCSRIMFHWSSSARTLIEIVIRFQSRFQSWKVLQWNIWADWNRNGNQLKSNCTLRDVFREKAFVRVSFWPGRDDCGSSSHPRSCTYTIQFLWWNAAFTIILHCIK